MDYAPPPPMVHEYKVENRWRNNIETLLEKGKRRHSKVKVFQQEKKRYREAIRPLNRAIVVFMDTIKHLPNDEEAKKLMDQLLHHRLKVIRKLNLQEVERYYFSKPLHKIKTLTKP